MVIGSDKPELSDLSGFYTLLFLVCTLWVCISTVTSAIKLSNCRQELAEVSLIFHILQLPMATLLRVSSSPHQFCLRVSVKLECVSTNQHPEVRWKIKVSTYLISTFCVLEFSANFFFFLLYLETTTYLQGSADVFQLWKMCYMLRIQWDWSFWEVCDFVSVLYSCLLLTQLVAFGTQCIHYALYEI